MEVPKAVGVLMDECSASTVRCGVGTPLLIDNDNRDAITAELSTFERSLSRDSAEVDHGLGANDLDGPPHALAHRIQVLADQPAHQPLVASEIITTGTITNMWPITPRGLDLR